MLGKRNSEEALFAQNTALHSPEILHFLERQDVLVI